MSHDQDAGSDEASEPPRGRSDERDSTAASDGTSARADARDDDSGSGDENGAVSATRNAVDEVDETLDAEIVDNPPKQKLRSYIAEWSGQLPHPDDSERYEQICPGTLDRLIGLQERRMGALEHDLRNAEQRELTIRSAVDAESDVKRILATSDDKALGRGQWLLWSISMASLGAVVAGLLLGYPQALWGIVVPIFQAGASLVRTVSQGNRTNPQSSE